VSHRRTTLTSAQALGSRSPVLSHRHVQHSRSLSHYVTQENHLEYHIISTLCTKEANTSFHLCLRTIHPTHGLPHTGAHNIPSLSQRGTTHPAHGLHNLTKGHNIPSLSQIGTTNPSHGLSLRSTHAICVLEDVSRSCNHQHTTLKQKQLMCAHSNTKNMRIDLPIAPYSIQVTPNIHTLKQEGHPMQVCYIIDDYSKPFFKSNSNILRVPRHLSSISHYLQVERIPSTNLG
jgi:hypothetical protein